MNIYVGETPGSDPSYSTNNDLCAFTEDNGFVSCTTSVTGRYIVFAISTAGDRPSFTEILAWDTPQVGSEVTAAATTNMSVASSNPPILSLFGGYTGQTCVHFNDITSLPPYLEFTLSESSQISDIMIVVARTIYIQTITPSVQDPSGNWVACPAI